jgi:hypothetical protein
MSIFRISRGLPGAAVLFFGLASVLAQPAQPLAQSAPGHVSDKLTLDGPGKHIEVSLAELRAMPQVTLTVMNNHAHARETYQGVPLVLLLRKVGAAQAADVKGKALSQYVMAIGADGYKVVLSLAEIEPAFHSGTVLVADSQDGKPLDAKAGPFKLVVQEDVQPARWVHSLVHIELRAAP